MLFTVGRESDTPQQIVEPSIRAQVVEVRVDVQPDEHLFSLAERALQPRERLIGFTEGRVDPGNTIGVPGHLLLLRALDHRAQHGPCALAVARRGVDLPDLTELQRRVFDGPRLFDRGKGGLVHSLLLYAHPR